ncbi:glycosyltransferase family 49 protein, partial [Coniophora puteana RWD-64-598 SS2]
DAEFLASSLPEHIILSKALANSPRPRALVPFYYRATPASRTAKAEFAHEDITLATLVTHSRFTVFKRLVERYDGPISVAVHHEWSHAHPAVASQLRALHVLYTSSPRFAERVDVHLVLAPHERALNTWRNVARQLARTGLVMMLDVDFAVCTDFRGALLNLGVVGARDAAGAGAIVPAFEYTRLRDGMDSRTFPRDKQSLLALVHSGKLDMFHRSWQPGHNSTDYTRYYAAAPGEVYKVDRYQAAYEPYVVFRRDGPPWCDERFVGYGGNKAACLFEMYLSGVSFYVLSDHFLIHQTHPYEEAARKAERKSNKKLYQDFKEEACLRYLRRHRDAGTLAGALGHNVRKECLKMRGV